MIELGINQTLKIRRTATPGIYLADEEGNEVLLPNRYITPVMKIGQSLNVFVYSDSEDRPVATTQVPLIFRNEFAYLKVKDVNAVGAFLDWGLEKDLLVPFRQQNQRMVPGQWYLVYLYLDVTTQRLAATTRVNSIFDKDSSPLEAGQEVDLLIAGSTEKGTKVVINNRYQGLIYSGDLFHDLLPGDRTKGFIRLIRPDKKIDVSLRKQGLENLEEGAQHILDELRHNGGFLPLTDSSSPEDIRLQLQMSKKNFKRSVGILYKQKWIALKPDGIRLNPKKK
ncbi:MAG: S1-like domain-containing RNA-binding protein [Cyclobacteriaceae bacterium]|nr:S1-like domain-containing RNA-binding protein [Cyclobacteriaceae bacterium]